MLASPGNQDLEKSCCLYLDIETTELELEGGARGSGSASPAASAEADALDQDKVCPPIRRVERDKGPLGRVKRILTAQK